MKLYTHKPGKMVDLGAMDLQIYKNRNQTLQKIRNGKTLRKVLTLRPKEFQYIAA